MTATVAARKPGAAISASERRVATATATGTLVLLTIVTATTFSRVFDGWDFLWPVLLPALAVHAVAVALRRTPGVVAIPLTGVALLLVSAWVHYRDTLWLGLPTRTTFTIARAELDAAWQQVGTVVPPVPHDAGFGLAAALALGLAALLADAFAFRGKGAVEATVPSGVLFMAIAAVGADRNRIASAAVWLAATILAAVVLRAMHEVSTDGWIGARTGGAWARWAAGGAGLAVLVAALAAIVGPTLPGEGAEPLIEHTKQRGDNENIVINPLVDLRDRLVDPSNAEVFAVASDRPAYWRLTGLPQFDGTSWNLPNSRLREAGGVLNDPPEYSTPVSQQFVIGALRGAFAPVAYTPTSLLAYTDDLYFVKDTSTLVLTDGLRAATSYNIVSALPDPPADVLASATSDDPPSSIYLDLPDGFADKYLPVAEQAVAGATTPYEQAKALQTWFRSTFTYSLDVPPSDKGEEIDDFLVRRTGFCVQFSTTYAAFARALGLPARVAMGFTPGDVGADGRYIVRERNAHAWPEVWFDDIGWVLFEPTPGRGAPGAEEYTGVPFQQDESGPGTPDPQGSTASTLNTAPVQTDPRLPGATTPVTVAPVAGEPATQQSSGGGPVPVGVWLVIVALLAAGAWALLMPRVIASRVAQHDAESQVARMWRSLVATAALVGVPDLAAKTALEQARAVADATNIDRGDTLELARAATVAVYSPHGLTEHRLTRSAEISDHLVRAVRGLLPWHRRVLAHLDPRLARSLAGG